MIDMGDDAKISYVRAVHYLKDNRTKHSHELPQRKGESWPLRPAVKKAVKATDENCRKSSFAAIPCGWSKWRVI
jgi:hypothetical protein